MTSGSYEGFTKNQEHICDSYEVFIIIHIMNQKIGQAIATNIHVIVFKVRFYCVNTGSRLYFIKLKNHSILNGSSGLIFVIYELVILILFQHFLFRN